MQLASHTETSSKFGKLCQKEQGVVKPAAKLRAEVRELAGMG